MIKTLRKIGKVAVCSTLFYTTIHAQQDQSGFNFDGTNDFATVVNSDIPSGNAPRTIEAWIQTTSSTSGGQQVILDYGNMNLGQRFTVNLLQNNSLRVEVGGSGMYANTPLNDGNWHHVAVSYTPNSSPNVSLYIDGVLENSGTFTQTVNTAANTSLYIGRRNDNVNYFNGSIDEVRVWNTAKTAAEIQSSMNNEICQATTDLVAYHNFNQGTPNAANSGNSTILDFSGNGNALSLTGTSLSGTSSNYIDGPAVLTVQMTASETSDYTCGSYFWPEANQTLTGIGTFTATLSSISGCDSVVQITLNTGLHYFSESVDTCTSNYTWPVNGTTYTSSGSYSETFTNIYGCDSIMNLNLSIGQNNTSTEQVISCPGYTWVVNGNTYNITGQYSETIQNTSGCDSTIILDLTVINLDNTVTHNNDLVITANAVNVNYQWIDCDDNNAEIPGETNASITVSENGNYACVISSGNCSDTTTCTNINYLSISENENDSFAYYPNPARNSLKLIFSNSEKRHLDIIDNSGRIVLSAEVIGNKTTLDISSLPKGAYTIKVLSNNGSFTNRFIKQ